jgi:hypothetical protein
VIIYVWNYSSALCDALVNQLSVVCVGSQHQDSNKTPMAYRLFAYVDATQMTRSETQNAFTD